MLENMISTWWMMTSAYFSAPVALLAGHFTIQSILPVAGMLFFNDEGDEVGGLTYTGRATDTTRRANAGIMFDQLNQDQTVGIEPEHRPIVIAKRLQEIAGLDAAVAPPVSLIGHGQRHRAIAELRRALGHGASFILVRRTGRVSADDEEVVWHAE